MNVKMGWNTPYGSHKFDLLLEHADLQKLLADNEIDPARLDVDHTNGEGKPDYITSLISFRLLYLQAEYISQTTLAFTAEVDPDPQVQKMSVPARQAATAAENSLNTLLGSLKEGKIR